MSDPAVSPPSLAGVGGRGSVVVRSGLLTMVGLVALGGTRLIHGSLVSRATDNQTFAEIGTLIGLAMTASLFLPGGLSSAASKFIPFQRGKGDPALARAAYRLITLVGLGCAVALGALVGLFAAVVLDVSQSGAIAAALLTAVFSMYGVAKGALYGFDRVVPYTWLEIAGSVVAVVATVVVVASGSHAYLFPLIFGYAVLMAGAAWVLRPRPHEERARLGAADRSEMAGYVGLASIGGLASVGPLQLLPLFAGWFTSAVEVSYFVAAVTLVAPLYFLPRALGMALFPEMSRAHGAGDVVTVRRHADISTRALLALLAPMFAVGIFVARDVLVLFGGAAYAPGAAVLQVLLAATYLSVIQVAAVNVLSSGTRREVRIPVYSAVAGSLVGLAFLIPLGTWFGSAGVAAAYLIAVGAVATGPMVAASRRYDMAWAHPLARSLVAVTVALAVALVVDATGMSGAGRVVLDVGLALAARCRLRRAAARGHPARETPCPLATAWRRHRRPNSTTRKEDARVVGDQPVRLVVIVAASDVEPASAVPVADHALSASEQVQDQRGHVVVPNRNPVQYRGRHSIHAHRYIIVQRGLLLVPDDVTRRSNMEYAEVDLLGPGECTHRHRSAGLTVVPH